MWHVEQVESLGFSALQVLVFFTKAQSAGSGAVGGSWARYTPLQDASCWQRSRSTIPCHSPHNSNWTGQKRVGGFLSKKKLVLVLWVYSSSYFLFCCVSYTLFLTYAQYPNSSHARPACGFYSLCWKMSLQWHCISGFIIPICRFKKKHHVLYI